MVLTNNDVATEAKDILRDEFDNNIIKFMYAVSIHIKDCMAIDYLHGSKVFEHIFNREEEYDYFNNIMFNINIEQVDGSMVISLIGGRIILSTTLREDSLVDYGNILLLILKETDTGILKVKDIPLRREIIEYIIVNRLGEIVYEE